MLYRLKIYGFTNKILISASHSISVGRYTDLKFSGHTLIRPSIRAFICTMHIKHNACARIRGLYCMRFDYIYVSIKCVDHIFIRCCSRYCLLTLYVPQYFLCRDIHFGIVSQSKRQIFCFICRERETVL